MIWCTQQWKENYIDEKKKVSQMQYFLHLQEVKEKEDDQGNTE